MKKVLIVYFSTSGKTETMAQYIAEGIRFDGLQAAVKTINAITDSEELVGCDGFIFGSPTVSLDIPNPVKKFLSCLKAVNLGGKLSGTFGPYLHDASYLHDRHAPSLILEILQNDYKMVPFELGAFSLRDDIVNTKEGIKACQDYGRTFGQRLLD